MGTWRLKPVMGESSRQRSRGYRFDREGESDCRPIDSHEDCLRFAGGSKGVVDDIAWVSHRYI